MVVIDIPGFGEEVQDGDKRAQQRFFAQHPVGLPIAYQGGKEGGGLYAAKFQGGAFSVHHRFGRGLPCKLDKRIPFLQDSVPTAAKKLLQSHINALSETHALVDEAALSRAAHYINHSDQVRFFGVGGSMLTAMEGMYKFLHIMPNVYCLSDIHMQTMGASTLNQHDTAVFISHSGASKEIVQMAQKAHEGGAKTIAITKYAKSPLTEYMDVVLLCGGYEPPLQEGSFPSKTAQMFVLDLLFTEVYRTQFDYSKEINKRVTTSILDKDY